MLKNINKLLPSLFPKCRCQFSITTAPKEEKIKVGDVYINHTIAGTGPHHVLCMPGAFGTIMLHFKAQFKAFDREKFTLVGWDPPGFGNSRPPLREFPVDMYDRDAEYAHELMKVLNIPKYSVIGMSAGGTSSLILAAKHPEAMRKMAVWGTRSFICAHELEGYLKLRDLNRWPKGRLNATAEVYGLELLAQYAVGWVDSIFEIYKTRDGNICDDLLKDITCPTLILHGLNDTLVDKLHPEHLHKNIQNSRLSYYPHVGHSMWIEQACLASNKVNKEIQDFFLEP